MAAEERININVNNSGPDNHWFTVIGTIAAIGGIGMLCWAISNAGYLDLAATGITMFIFQLISMMFKVGMLKLPENKEGTFKETSGFVRTAIREFYEWQAKSPIWRLAALALGFTLAFLIARWGISVALGIFQNVWIAGAASALAASVIIAPRLYGGLIKQLKSMNAGAKKNQGSEEQPQPAPSEPAQPAEQPEPASSVDRPAEKDV